MQENPYAPPKADLTPHHQSTAIINASRWHRLAASLLDTLLSLVFLIPIIYFTGGYDGLSDGQENSLLYNLAVAAVGIIIFIAIHATWLKKYGQTVGKKALGIKITDLEGNLPDIKSHLLPRYSFIFLIPQIPLLGGFLSIIDALFIFGKERRCLHDRIAKTIVIQA